MVESTQTDSPAATSLQRAVQSLADALGVPLLVVRSQGRVVVPWQHPASAQSPAEAAVPTVGQVPDEKLEELQITGDAARRRFAVSFRTPEGVVYTACSGELPTPFAWIDGKLRPQVLPGYDFPMESNPAFLVGFLISHICQVVLRDRSLPGQTPLDDLGMENIRRVVVSIRSKIDPVPGHRELVETSLDGIPSLEEFFLRAPVPTAQPDLTKAFEQVTADAAGSVNIMSLNGDFVIGAHGFRHACEAMRRRGKIDCFLSDIECLLEAALVLELKDGIHCCKSRPCHAHFTELFAPVFVDGLIVGLVFAGQLIETPQQLSQVKHYASTVGTCTDSDLGELSVTKLPLIESSKKIASALAALIGLLFDAYCVARNEAALLESLVDLPAGGIDQAFEKICRAAKRYLGITECSVFRLEGKRLILAATTCLKLKVRDIAQGQARVVNAAEALGKAYYQVGEGLTGSVVLSEKPLAYYPHPKDHPAWSGKCSEIDNASQCLVARIAEPGGTCYGVLRGSRPGEFSEITIATQKLFGNFAKQLGIMLHSHELRQAEDEGFRSKASQLQDLLAHAGHEFKGPLHNILSLVTALRFTTGEAERKDIHQRIKEAAYRAKRNTDNYLLRGIEGKEQVKYNFQPCRIGDLVSECASRFLVTAEKKGVRLLVGPEMKGLPEIIADKERLDQVFSNIIDNAVKYSFDNHPLKITAREKANTVTIAVADFGLGIPPQYRKVIFQGYTRAVEDQTRFKTGTGLGLKIASEIVKAHGGEIQVDSESVFEDRRRLAKHEGFYTVFRVSLPKAGPTGSQGAPKV